VYLVDTDVIIAATAVHHSLTVLTRNVKHFEPFGVALQDPFLALPE
jgi:predicted nucleic acid-binding protein